MEFFESDVSNVVKRVREILQKRSESPIEYHLKIIRSMQEFSRTHLTHFGLARAMAYALSVYAKKITWKPKMEDGYIDVLENQGRLTNPSLPIEFVQRIKNNGKM